MEAVSKTFEVGAVRVVATYSHDEADGVAVTRLEISGPQITAADIRKIPFSRIEALGRLPAAGADLGEFKGRLPGEDPVQFSRRVAEAYSTAATLTHRPAMLLSEQAGVPAPTVRAWVREARLRGLLPPGRQGKSG